MTSGAKAYAAWAKIARECWMLNVEASTVIALRMARITVGGAEGAAEAELMVTEKIRAALELQTRLMTGSLGVTPLASARGTLAHYRRKVAANNRRLRARQKSSAD